MPNKLERAFELFDNFNKQDPNTIVWNGINYPAEFFYALQLYNHVTKLKPDASETLLLASRSQHIGRWKSPRENYPVGKAGYYKWRTDLAKFHADTAGLIMSGLRYTEREIEAVQRIITKQQLKTDAEVQTMEDALCLVFLEFQFEDFLAKHPEEKVITVLQRSWKKMSRQGRDAALMLPFSGRGKEMIEKALA